METAVLFAGGKSRRMGRDKALLDFGGISLVRYQYERLQALFEKVYISTKEDKFDFKADLIYDTGDTYSPAVALQSVLQTLESEAVFVLSVDAPFVDGDIIYTLYSQLGSRDLAVAKTQGGMQPLCGIYTKKVLPLLAQMIQKDNHRLGFLIKAANSKIVPFEQEELFLNCNHPHEYEKALALAKAHRL